MARGLEGALSAALLVNVGTMPYGQDFETVFDISEDNAVLAGA
jgi:hypothetical protein